MNDIAQYAIQCWQNDLYKTFAEGTRNQLFKSNVVSTIGVMLEMADSESPAHSPLFSVPHIVKAIHSLPGRAASAENEDILRRQVDSVRLDFFHLMPFSENA